MKPVAPVTSTVWRGGKRAHQILGRRDGRIGPARRKQVAQAEDHGADAANTIRALQYPCETSLIEAGSSALHATSSGSTPARGWRRN